MILHSWVRKWFSRTPIRPIARRRGHLKVEQLEDRTVPSVSTPDLHPGSDSGSSNTDNYTNVTTPTFTGTADPNATVELREGGTLLASGMADGSGNWTISIPGANALSNGSHDIFARSNATDSTALTVTIDTIAPSVSAPDLTAGSDSGNNTDNVTNQTLPTFTGTAEAGATVTVQAGSTRLGVGTADGSGNWTVTDTLAFPFNGLFILHARAYDAAGNEGFSGFFGIIIDTSIPRPAAPPDLDPASDTGSSNTDNLTRDTTPTFTGTATANATVEVRITPGTFLGATTADGSGNWSLTVPAGSALADGNHDAYIRVIVGTNTDISPSLAFTIDTVATASAPDLDPASDTGSSNTDNVTSDTTPTFTGTAEANASVELRTTAGASLGTTSANGSGNWSFTVPAGSALADGVYTVFVRATDAAGNTTDNPSLTITIDTSPAAPTGIVINQGAAQRSMVTSITLSYASALTETQKQAIVTALSLSRVGGGPAVMLNGTLDATGMQLTLRFSGSGIIAGSLADGRYTLAQGANTLLNGTQLFRIFGDSNGDGQVDVNGTDYKAFMAVLNKRVANSPFDYYGRGVIDGMALAQFNLRKGKKLDANGNLIPL